jgi:outer membrane receptor protein involved in Fe transport
MRTKFRLSRDLSIGSPTCLFLLLMGVASSARAQSNTATIQGTVTDQGGSVIPDATVTAAAIETGQKKTTTTDPKGQYTILSLQPGLYDVQVSAPGFSTEVEKNQQLFVGTTTTYDFQLKISSVSQTVEVTAPALVAVTESTVSTIVDPIQLNQLPDLTRSFAELATLTPGVESAGVNTAGTAAGSAGKASVLVSLGNTPTYGVNYMLNGVTNELANQGGPVVTLAQDWVKEFSVLNLQFPAEYGDAAGGVVNLITLSGTNQVHGRVYEFYQNAEFNSNPEFYKGTVKAPYDSERVGGMVGGPIIKDKLFFFAGYEYYRNLATDAYSTQVLSTPFASTAQPVNTPAAQLVPWLIYGTGSSGQSIGTENLAMARLDYTPNEKNSFQFTSNLDYERVNGGGSGASTLGSATSYWQPAYTETLGWTRTISTKMINELRFAYMPKLENPETNYDKAKGYYTGITLNQNPYNYTTTQSLGGATFLGNPDGNWAGVSYTGVSTGGGNAGVDFWEADGVVSDALSYVVGSHQLKFGGSLRRYADLAHNVLDNSVMSYTFGGTATAPFNPNVVIPSTSLAAEELVAPLSVGGFAPFSQSTLDWVMPSYSFGVFAEDTWQARSNLTFNIGLRYDFSNMYSALGTDSFPALAKADPGSTGFIQPGWNKVNNDGLLIAPRVGLAWQPTHNPKTVIRGGVGIFYDNFDTAPVSVYVATNSEINYAIKLSANTATSNPYCSGNTSCASGIPLAYETAVVDVLAAALANYTLPQFPVSTSPCAATNSCTATVGPNTYTVPALSIPFNPQGGRLNLDQNLKIPGTSQYTVGAQHQFGQSFTASADFVYRYLFYGPNPVNSNVALTGFGASQTYETVNPAYTQLTSYTSDTFLKSKDLDLQASYLDHRGDTIRLSYQFGYAHDDAAFNMGWSGFPSTLQTNPFNPKYDYGPSFNDARNILNVSGTVNMGWGFDLAPIVNFTSALPMTATSSVQAPGSADAPPGCEAYFTHCYPLGYSRNSLRGDDYLSLNTRLQKQVRIKESKSFDVYVEGFNVTNKHNLGTNYLLNVDSKSTFLTPSGTSLPLRQLQLGGRFDF